MDNELLQERAERTFHDLLDIWVGYETPMPYPVPNIFQNIRYLKLDLPPLSNEVPQLWSNWFILASVKEPLIKHSEELNCDCYELNVDEKMLEGLYEFCRSEKDIYLAFAVVRNGDGRGITSLPIFERYDWYVIDLKQYFNRLPSWRANRNILVPKHNILNLATFSLIWSAQWVSAFHAPFYDKRITQNIKLITETNKIFSPQYGIDYSQSVKDQKSFLSKVLPTVRNDIDDSLFVHLVTRLGLGVALNDINSQMRNKREIDKIYNYCPEALYGTANLWLFSRAYHNFMLTSSEVAAPFRNMRLLPIFTDELIHVPPILKSVIWQVLLYYKYLKVDVRIVPAPRVELEPGRDRSFYGGGIGYFPWLIISEEDLRLDYHTSTKANANENLEFLTWLSGQVLVSKDFNTSQAVKDLFILKDFTQLELKPRKPTILFPSPDSYLDHPDYLWVLSI